MALKWVAGAGFVVFVLVLGIVAVAVGPERVHEKPEGIRAAEATTRAAEAPAPDEPCEVSGPFKDNPNIKVWCTGGIFTKVNVTSDGNVMVGSFQFSKKG